MSLFNHSPIKVYYAVKKCSKESSNYLGSATGYSYLKFIFILLDYLSTLELNFQSEQDLTRTEKHKV